MFLGQTFPVLDALNVREAHLGDAPGIARVHVDAWRETFQGMMPDSLLARLDVANRTLFWEQEIARSAEARCIFIAERKDGEIVGFAAGGPERSGDKKYTAELYAIYLLKVVQGLGVGRRLFEAVARRLAGLRHKAMLLWVLERNPSRGFYESMGGRRIGSKIERVGDTELEEISFGFDVSE